MDSKILVKALGPAMGYPSYRAYWLGTLASVAGFQMLSFSQFWIIHELTQSPLYLGYVGLANAIPSIALNLFGGVIADRLDRQRLIALTQTVNGTLILVLAVLTAAELVEAWHVIILAFIAGGVNAFDQPARQALYPGLIERKVMMNAVALNTSIWTGTRIVAPAAAGLIITLAGTATSFLISSAGFFTMAIIVLSLKVSSPERSQSSRINDLIEGVRFIFKNNVFLFLISMTFFISFFGMSYIPMMPVFAVEILKVGADGQGVMMGFGGIGALGMTLFLGRIKNLRYRGQMIVLGSACFGLSLAALAVTSEQLGSYPLATLLMFAMGAVSSVYMISIMSSLQLMVPDQMRGRVMGFYGMTWSIMPLGGMYVGALAGAFGDGSAGVPTAVAIGGVMVALFAVGPVFLNKDVRNLDALIESRQAAGKQLV